MHVLRMLLMVPVLQPVREDSAQLDKERKLQHKISELNAKVRKLDDQSTALVQDKADLVSMGSL